MVIINLVFIMNCTVDPKCDDLPRAPRVLDEPVVIKTLVTIPNNEDRVINGISKHEDRVINGISKHGKIK